jgi:hypothetical protein
MEQPSTNRVASVAYNGTTLEVLWGIELILKYDPFAKIGAANDIVYFGAYSSRKLMTENEQIDMSSWGWLEKNGCWSRSI